MVSQSEVVKVVDLFAGIGGLRQEAMEAFVDAGYIPEVVFTSEIKKDAIKTLKANWSEDKISGDITKIAEKNIPEHDLLLAGFPCQTFSFAGNRKGFADTRGTLFFDVLRVLKYRKPKFFILENVEGLIKHDPDPAVKNVKVGRTLQTILSELVALGYSVDWKLLVATDYGVPQARKRIFIVGSLVNVVDFGRIVSTPSGGVETILEKNPNIVLTDVEKVFQKMLLAKHSAASLVGKKIGNKRGGLQNIHTWDFSYLGAVNADEKHLLDSLLTERRKKIFAIAHGTPSKDGIPLTTVEIASFYTGGRCVQSVINSLVQKGYLIFKNGGYDITGGKLSFPYSNILDPKLPTPTVVASDADRLAVVQGDKLRRLTEVEFKRLFGFQDNYIIPADVSKRAVYDLFGNSVVIPMAKAAATLLL